MSERFEADDTFAGGDPLAPERIEGTLLAAQTTDAPETPETTLVRALADAYALPREADGALARVHARLRVATLAPESPAEEEADQFEYEPSQGRPRGMDPVPFHTRRASRFGAALRAIAAVLVVALLGAGFYAALHRSGGNTSRPGQAEQPGWHDVGITQARATQPLDFDLILGVTYAVNETTGDIYACGGSGHIWSSANGGATYAPFPVIPPASPQGSVSCAIATVPGDSGLFIQLAKASGLTQTIAHVSFPGRLMTLLKLPTAAVSPVDPSVRTTVNPDQLTTALFTHGNPGAVQMAGGWLYATVWDDQLSRTVLLGTSDFGQHWYWLDGLFTTRFPLLVTTFAIDPAAPNRMYLGVRPNATADGVPGIAMSMDGGKTWLGPLGLGDSSSYGAILVGASKTTVFALTQDGPDGHTTLLRRDATTPGVTWQRVTQMPAALESPGGAQVLDVGPDGSVYAVEAVSDGQVARPIVTIRAYTLMPGASAFRLVSPQSTLTPAGEHFAFALGAIWSGGRPALYMDSGTGARTSRVLYRLALSPTAGSPNTPTP